MEPGPELLTCAVTASVCETARLDLGFAPALPVAVPPGTVTFTVADNVTSLVWSAQFDGADPGLGFSCDDVRCGEPDWTASGQRLYVEARQEDGGELLGVYTLFGNVLERNPSSGIGTEVLTGLNADDRVAAVFLPEAAAINIVNFGAVATRFDSGSGQYNTGRLGQARLPSYQVTNDHPLSLTNDIALLILETNQDLSVYIDDGSGAPAHIQHRPGSRVIGAAWASDGSGDIAIIDELANGGVLRIAPYATDDVVTVADLDVNAIPVWLPGDQTVVVLADTNDGVNTADGSVAVLDPPAGFDIVGGPSIRP
ncbi:MAG: hypothetical protein ACR2HR_09510 [Euzebya sp.]